VRGNWRKLHVIYVSQSISVVIKSRRMRWVEHVARVGGVKQTDRQTHTHTHTHSSLVRNQKERNSLKNAGHRWKDNIKINLEEI